MNQQTKGTWRRASCAIVAVIACLPLSGCSRAPTSENSSKVSNRESPAAPSPTKGAGQSPDVIVVGAGISGISAALDLGRGGAKVAVIDMSSVFGGHAVMSQGSVSIVATPAQKRLGIDDSPDLAFQDFQRWGEDPNTDWVRYYVEHSRRDIYDWLDELGVRFSEVLASSGNSVPREHQPVGRGIGLVSPQAEARNGFLSRQQRQQR